MINPMNIMQMVSQLKANPAQFLAQRKINLPAGVGNDPNAIIQSLLQNGRFTQDDVNRAYQQAAQFRK